MIPILAPQTLAIWGISFVALFALWKTHAAQRFAARRHVRTHEERA